MNHLVVENVHKDGDLPMVEINVYSTHSATKKIYQGMLKFTGKRFEIYRVYNGEETQSMIGASPEVQYEKYVKEYKIPKMEIIGIMKCQIMYAINDYCCIINDLYKGFIDTPRVFPHKVTSELLDVENFMELCYFMIS